MTSWQASQAIYRRDNPHWAALIDDEMADEDGDE